MEILNKLIVLALSLVASAVLGYIIGGIVGVAMEDQTAGAVVFVIATVAFIPIVINKVKEFWKGI